MKVMVIPIVMDTLGTIPQGVVKGPGRLGNKRINEDHPDYRIIMIGQNTDKSPGDSRRLVVLQTPTENHLQELVWKLSKE